MRSSDPLLVKEGLRISKIIDGEIDALAGPPGGLVGVSVEQKIFALTELKRAIVVNESATKPLSLSKLINSWKKTTLRLDIPDVDNTWLSEIVRMLVPANQNKITQLASNFVDKVKGARKSDIHIFGEELYAPSSEEENVVQAINRKNEIEKYTAQIRSIDLVVRGFLSEPNKKWKSIAFNNILAQIEESKLLTASSSQAREVVNERAALLKRGEVLAVLKGCVSYLSKKESGLADIFKHAVTSVHDNKTGWNKESLSLLILNCKKEEVSVALFRSDISVLNELGKILDRPEEPLITIEDKYKQRLEEVRAEIAKQIQVHELQARENEGSVQRSGKGKAATVDNAFFDRRPVGRTQRKNENTPQAEQENKNDYSGPATPRKK